MHSRPWYASFRRVRLGSSDQSTTCWIETRRAVVLKRRVCAHSTASAHSWTAKWGRVLLGGCQLEVGEISPAASYSIGVTFWSHVQLTHILSTFEASTIHQHVHCWVLNLRSGWVRNLSNGHLLHFHFHLLTDMFSISPKPINCRQNSGWIESCNNFTGVFSINFTACDKN